MKFPLVVLFASLVVAAGCTGSETGDMPGSGGRTGSGSGGSGGSGSGGSGESGSGGGSGGLFGSSSGGTFGSGTGGAFGSGTGGTRADAGTDTSPSDAGADASDAPLSYNVDVAYILYFNCGGCHLSGQTQGGFDMKIVDSLNPGPAAYPAITASVTSDHAGCTALDSTKKRVVPFKPNNSLLYIKISSASPPSGCGGHMPNGANMAANQIATIKTWITQGAKP